MAFSEELAVLVAARDSLDLDQDFVCVWTEDQPQFTVKAMPWTIDPAICLLFSRSSSPTGGQGSECCWYLRRIIFVVTISPRQAPLSTVVFRAWSRITCPDHVTQEWKLSRRFGRLEDELADGRSPSAAICQRFSGVLPRSYCGVSTAIFAQHSHAARDWLVAVTFH